MWMQRQKRGLADGASELAQNIGGAVSGAGHHLSDWMQQGAHDAVEHCQEMGTNSRHIALDAMNQARRAAGRYYDRAQRGAVGAEQWVEDCISTRPLSSVLVAAGAGLLVGLMMKWSARRRTPLLRQSQPIASRRIASRSRAGARRRPAAAHA